MHVYAYSEAIQNFALLLEEAFKEGEVRVQRDDGEEFIIKPVRKHESPLDVEGIDLGITTEATIHGRRKAEREILVPVYSL